MVFRLASILARYRSPFVVEKSRQLHEGEKRMLDLVLPDQFRTSTRKGKAIMVATSFDSWRHLRQDEELSAKATVEAIKEMVGDICDWP